MASRVVDLRITRFCPPLNRKIDLLIEISDVYSVGDAWVRYV